MQIPDNLTNSERGIYIVVKFMNIRKSDDLMKLFKYSRKSSLNRALENVYRAMREGK